MGLNNFGIYHRGLGPSHQQFVGKHLAVVADRQGTVQVGTDFHRSADQATLPTLGWENAQPLLMVLAGELPGQLAGFLQAQDVAQAFRGQAGAWASSGSLAGRAKRPL